MKRLMAGMLIGAGLLCTIPAQAETGNDLLKQCQAYNDDGEENAFISGQCQGKITAVLAVRDSLAKAHNTKNACVPNGVTNGQLGLIVEKYLREHPEQLHENDTALIFVSLVQAYPCSK